MSKFTRMLKGIASKGYVPDTYTPADRNPRTWKGSWVDAYHIRVADTKWFKATPQARKDEQRLVHVEVDDD